MKCAASSSPLILPTLFVALVVAAYLLTKSSSGNLAGLGSNLIAEFIGTAVTVFGIGYLIKRREQARLLPMRASSYEDVRLMTHWALDLWRDAYESSVGDGDPTSWEELLAEDSLDKIGISLDINKPAKVHPPQPWSIYFDSVSERIHKHAEKVLERHGFVLDPEVQNAVYAMVYNGGHKISMIQEIDRHDQIPRPTNLASYVPMIRAWFDAVLSLHTWTVETHKYLAQHGNTNIHDPYLFRPLEIKTPPSAAFDPGVLHAQAATFKQWQNRKDSAPAVQQGAKADAPASGGPAA